MSRFLRGKTSNNDNHYCYRVTHLDASQLEIAFERSKYIQPLGIKGGDLVGEALMRLVRNISEYGLYFDFLTCIYILKKCQSKLTTLYIVVVVVATLWDPTMVCQTAEETTKAFLSFMCILLTDTLLFQFKIRAKYHI